MFSGEEKATKAPFFHAKRIGDTVQVRGLTSCSFGHKLAAHCTGTADGIYAEWSWDGARLTVQNDRSGFYPLFYFCRGSEIALSPSIVTLVDRGAPTELDSAALAVFFRLGYFLGDDTPFEQIRALPPGASFLWDGALTVSGNRPVGRPGKMSRDEAVDGYIELFRKAVRRRLPKDGNFAMPISGGRDSRHILLELCEVGCPPRYCITTTRYPPRSLLDVKEAQQLARAVGVEHVVVSPLPRFEAEFRNHYETQFCADEHAWVLGVADYLLATVHSSYHGIGGDDLSSEAYMTPETFELYRDGRLDDLADVFLREKQSLELLYEPPLREAMGYDAAHSRLVEELKRYVDAPSPLRMFNFWNRTRREIALVPCGILRELSAVYCPYVDHELFDFLASVPDSHMMDGTFHTDAILRGYPKYANVPFWQVSPRASDVGHFAKFALKVAAYAATKRPAWCIRNSHVLWRWFRCLLSRHYRRANHMWLSPTRLLYILHVETLKDRGRQDRGGPAAVDGQFFER